MTKPTREEMIQKVKDRIDYYAYENKNGYFLHMKYIDDLAKDILKKLQIIELTARAEAAEKKLKEAVMASWQERRSR